MRSLSLVFLVFVAGATTGCVALDGIGLTAEKCATYNWRQEGFELAQRGEKVSASYRARKCTEQNPQHMADYKVGFSDGQKKFCSEEFGLYWGRKDEDYRRGFCPAQLENKFLAGFSKGKLEFDRLQLLERNTTALETLALQNKSCFSDLDCDHGQECVQNTQSSSSMDRVCLEPEIK